MLIPHALVMGLVNPMELVYVMQHLQDPIAQVSALEISGQSSPLHPFSHGTVYTLLMVHCPSKIEQ